MIEFASEPIHVKDFVMAFFMALALRRGRIDALVGGFLKYFPTESNPKLGPGEVGKRATTTTDDFSEEE